MTLKITVSVQKNTAYSAVVTYVDNHGEPVSHTLSEIVDPGEAKDFYVYSDHNILIGEISFEETENQPPSTVANFVHRNYKHHQQSHVHLH